MNQESDITQKDFDFLLNWLDADRDQAGKKYEYIRLRLIRIFTCRGCQDAEELADKTINRVILIAPRVAPGYVGDPALYFYAVAQRVFLESLRKRPPAVIPAAVVQSDEIEQVYECLERCMEKLSTHNRELALEYYKNDKRAKINHRRGMAQEMGIGLNALRIRAHRIRTLLHQCVQACLQQEVAI